MSNTIWNEWYYTDRFLGKPYPFVDNYGPKSGSKDDCGTKRKYKRKDVTTEEKDVTTEEI